MFIGFFRRCSPHFPPFETLPIIFPSFSRARHGSSHRGPQKAGAARGDATATGEADAASGHGLRRGDHQTGDVPMYPSTVNNQYNTSLNWLVGQGHPSEKYESQLGGLFPIYGKIKHVPNHQPEQQEISTTTFHGTIPRDPNWSLL